MPYNVNVPTGPAGGGNQGLQMLISYLLQSGQQGSGTPAAQPGQDVTSGLGPAGAPYAPGQTANLASGMSNIGGAGAMMGHGYDVSKYGVTLGTQKQSSY